MERRDRLLDQLHDIQHRSGRNWLPAAELDALAEHYGMLRADILGVASYYSMLSLKPRGRHIIRLCSSPICRMMGSEDLLAWLCRELAIGPGETTADGSFTLETCQCLGHCAEAPAMMIDDRIYNHLSIGTARAAIAEIQRAEIRQAGLQPAGVPETGEQQAGIQPTVLRTTGSTTAISMVVETRIALRYLDIIDPDSLASYQTAGGYAALRTALGQPSEQIVGDLSRAGLRGRGGAGFPTGTKERSTAQTCDDCDRYVVVNADEGEPGTFKDRIIMEQEPHLLLEGLIISAWAIGARMGYIYVRGEYALCIQRLLNAIDQAKAAGLLGENILGSGFDFDVELRRGAGSYLCGEELTLLESLEGRRGYPRIKPPYPAEQGLWGKPTLINNVETLANVPWIVEHGVDAYLALGTSGSPGTKIFCISGDVARPGYYEAELGLSLRSLIEDFAGGVVNGTDGVIGSRVAGYEVIGSQTTGSRVAGRQVAGDRVAGSQTTGSRVAGSPAPGSQVAGGLVPRAVLLGGAAGTFAAASRLDIPLDYDALKQAGLTLGSGAVIVLGPNRDIATTIAAILEFFKHESCGKCVPCRVGTGRLAAASQALCGMSHDARLQALDTMVQEADMMARTSLCPLGQSPILPLGSAARELREVL
jgi:NADH-quinone oxidoreductase subunit F